MATLEKKGNETPRKVATTVLVGVSLEKSETCGLSTNEGAEVVLTPKRENEIGDEEAVTETAHDGAETEKGCYASLMASNDVCPAERPRQVREEQAFVK